MLTQRPDDATRFTRRDAGRLAIVAVVLIGILTAIFAMDIIPTRAEVEIGSLATRDIVAPRALTYVSEVRTDRLRAEARASVGLLYDFTRERAETVAAAQVGALRRALVPVNVAFAATTPPEERRAILEETLPELSGAARQTLLALEPERWTALSAEAERVLEAVELVEIREPAVPEIRTSLPGRVGASFDQAERGLVAEIAAPFVVANSTYSQQDTDAERERRAAEVEDVEVRLLQGQIIVRAREVVTEEHLEAIDELGLREAAPDFARLAGWFLLAALLVGLLLAWVWRFRPELWHRNNVLVLVSLLVVFSALALKLTVGRATLPFLIPTAAVGMLLAILLDAGAATVVVAVIAVIAGALHGNSLELMAYTLFGGFAGIVAIRRGDRLHVFLQAGIAVFVVNALVVSTFSLLGARDLTGVVQLWAASLGSAGGAAIAAVGSFAVLGNLFGILTVFQLLELANPSQPLLRRLLVETPGTYHHSIMVGNLAERAAEAIGADPLLTRVAAYYHDIGKLANPMAFIENQAGGENVHDQLEPEMSAQVLKQHVADGIDIAYAARLPKSLIAFIPQHHGTAIMSYFYARAKEQAAEPYGGPTTAEGRKAADAVEARKFRHAGPKPQSREAALIMLADGVEASVRSLSSRDEPAIRAMVTRIIDERLGDGQFDECDLTLRDLERIREAFVAQLLGMYHQRIAYPQNKVVELESRRGSGTGA